MKITSRKNLNILTYLSDILALSFSFFIAYYLRNFGPFRIFLDSIQPVSVYLWALPFATLLLLIVFWLSHLYEETKWLKPISEFYGVTKAVAIWALLIMAGSYLYKYDYSRIIVVLTSAFLVVLTNLGRTAVRSFIQKLYKKGIGHIRILIIGAGRPGRELARRLKSYVPIGYQLVGFIDDRATNRKNFPVIGKIDDIEKIMEKERVDEVYITDPTLSHAKILNIMAKYPKRNVRFRVVSSIFGLVSGVVDVSRLESIPSFELWRSQKGWWTGIPKRIFDIAFSSILYITTSPFWLIISSAIILTDGTPATLKQKRVGQAGKIFYMLKFRTMKKGSAKYADGPRTLSDERITSIGKFLRKTSLDELPQLINVIKGEMSMVGPRPEMPQKVAKYNPWQAKRLEAKPGLTGLWQILGRKDLPLEENLEYDFYYLNNQSFILDMTIIVKTIPLILSGKGAY